MQLLFVADPLCVASMSFYLEMEPSASFLERGGGGYLHTKRLMEEAEGVRREQLKYGQTLVGPYMWAPNSFVYLYGHLSF